MIESHYLVRQSEVTRRTDYKIYTRPWLLSETHQDSEQKNRLLF